MAFVRRHLRWILLGGIVTLALAWFVWYQTPPFGISERSQSRIETNMTEDEVTAIVGLPPGDYGIRGWVHFERVDDSIKRTVRWRGPRGHLFVRLDRNDRVVESSFESTDDTRSIWQRIQDAIGW